MGPTSLILSGFTKAVHESCSRKLDNQLIWPYIISMATPKIKSTYSLDVETVHLLEALAQKWNVSKSKALQRSIHAAAQQQPPADTDALEALDLLQSSLHLDEATASRWERDMRQERRETATRMSPGE